MSGGANEYMASYISGKFGDSGFNATKLASYNAKYFDVYNAKSDGNAFQYRILGDATGEMGPFVYKKEEDGISRWQNSWYSDESFFLGSGTPWLMRSGNYTYGVLAGQFCYDDASGENYEDGTSRLVLLG